MSQEDTALLTKLSKDQIHTFRSLFNLIDQDQDSMITIKDLKTTIVKIGIDNIDDDTIGNMIPASSDNNLNFNSFLKIMNSKFGNFSSKTELTQAFAAFNDPQSTKNLDNINSNKLKIALQETCTKSTELNFSKKDISKIVEGFTESNALTGEKLFDANKFIDVIHN